MSETQRIIGGLVSTFAYCFVTMTIQDMARGYCEWPRGTKRTKRLIYEVCAALSPQSAGQEEGKGQ